MKQSLQNLLFSKMELSIVIVNFNTAKITNNCLDSLKKYPYRERFEVILIDNNSNDDSDKLLKNFKSDNFDYKYIKNTDNLGFSKANNIGLKSSLGKYKLLLNSDTKVTKDALNILVDTAKQNINAGLIGARLFNSDGSVQESVFNLPTFVRTIRHYWFGHKILEKYYPKNFSKVESVVFAAVLITPIAIEKVGLLNEKYFMYFEDLDYCRRVRRNGLDILYEPKSEIYHLHGASGVSDWRRLIPSAKIYHGKISYYLIYLVTWMAQKTKI